MEIFASKIKPNDMKQPDTTSQRRKRIHQIEVALTCFCSLCILVLVIWILRLL